MAAKGKKVVVGVTGSIAAYKSADIIRRLSEKEIKVSVVMTKGAEAFITPLTLSSLIGEAVYCDSLDADQKPWQMPHIQLAQEADLLLIAPATANILGKMACGMADNLLTCIFLATRAPVVVAPAMNDGMYRSKIVQENCAKLKKAGVEFVEPVEGKLACGTVGVGHIADVEEIVGTVEWILKKRGKK